MIEEADWKGSIKKRFRWSHFRCEFGRWCYRTNCCGNVIRKWWEWYEN